MSACRSCGAPITWMITNTGKTMPVDGLIQGQPAEPNMKFDPKVHVSHFATCPNAAKHRKPKTTALQNAGGK